MKRVPLSLAALTCTLTLSVGLAQNGGALRLAYSAVKQLDPYTITADNEINVTSQSFDTLVYTD